MNQYLIENFAENEFKNMMFDVSVVQPPKHVITSYPRLRKIKEFKTKFTKLSKDKVIRYIMLLYDKNSPFRIKFNDVLIRKVEVAKGAGWEIEDHGLFNDEVERLLRGENKHVNRMIIAFVRLHRNFKYSYLIALEETFYRFLLETITGEIKNMAQMKSTQGELEELITELLNQDKNPYIREELLRYVEEARLNLRPEDIARIAKQKEREQKNQDQEEVS